MTQVRARVQCCRLGCRTSHEYWADLCISEHVEDDPPFSPIETAKICLSSPGGGWVQDGHGNDSDRYVCPDCVLKEKL
jgi:hypothetical protein